jgi:FtsZ-interacting cell division protein ZipA
MFILDDVLVLGGVGLVVLLVVGARAVRRRRLNKKLAKDKQFRDRVSTALDEADVEWIKADVGAVDYHKKPPVSPGLPIPSPEYTPSQPIDIPVNIPVHRVSASVPNGSPPRPRKSKRKRARSTNQNT